MQAAGIHFLELFLLLGLSLGGGNDLLDLISTEEYWQREGLVVTPEVMLAQLAEEAPKNVDALIKQLGADSFEAREEATRRLQAMGPQIAPQIERAAKVPDAEVASRARQILKRLGSQQREGNTRKLMAIHTLGELRHRPALEKLAKLSAGDDAILARFAKRAVAKIEGRPPASNRPPLEELDADLALLPAGCGLVFQVAGQIPAMPIESVVEELGKGLSEDQVAMSTDRMHDALFDLLSRTGNFRLDAVTCGLSSKIGPREGFVVFVARGRYDRNALRAALSQPPLRVREEDGVFIASPEPEFQILMPSDRRLVFVGGPEGLPVDDMLTKLAAGTKQEPKLEQSAEMTKLVRSLDRQRLAGWAVVEMSEMYRQAPVFKPVRFLVAQVELKQDMQSGVEKLSGRAVAHLVDGADPEPALAEFERGLKNFKEELQRASARMPAMELFLEAVQSVHHERRGGSVVVTAEADHPTKLLMAPMLLFTLRDLR